MIQLSVINESTAIGDGDVQALIPAFQAQWNCDLAPIWSLEEAQFVFSPKGSTPPSRAWWVVFLDNRLQDPRSGALFGPHRRIRAEVRCAEGLAAGHRREGDAARPHHECAARIATRTPPPRLREMGEERPQIRAMSSPAGAPTGPDQVPQNVRRTRCSGAGGRARKAASG